MSRGRPWPPRLDPPSTLLGRLQRGLGCVAREISDGGVPEASELVLSCLEGDPRWDSDLDDRKDYYATLAISAGVDVGAVEAVAADEPRGDGADRGASWQLGVLARMAARGNTDAISAVRRYFARGRYWDWVVDWLAGDGWTSVPADGWPEWVDGLAPVLCERYPTVELMAEAFESRSPMPLDRAPWPQWGTRYPLIGRAIAGAVETVEDQRKAWMSSHDYAEQSTATLLAMKKQGEARRVAKWLASRTGEEDVELMLRAAEDRSLAMHVGAVNALACQQRTEVLSAVLELSAETGRGITRALLFEAFRALPYTATQNTATEWLIGSDDTRRSAAASAMADHATEDDLPLVTSELSRELDRELEGDQYVVCSLSQALGRHPARGPFPELDRAFREMPYSHGRRYVVDAIAATDPRFPEQLAIDSLWDCEPTVRATAAKHVRRENPIAAARLREIRSDPLEDKEVQAAAL